MSIDEDSADSAASDDDSGDKEYRNEEEERADAEWAKAMDKEAKTKDFAESDKFIALPPADGFKLVDALETSSRGHKKNDRLEASAVVRSALRCTPTIQQ